jgi:hypothetical protein
VRLSAYGEIRIRRQSAKSGLSRRNTENEKRTVNVTVKNISTKTRFFRHRTTRVRISDLHRKSLGGIACFPNGTTSTKLAKPLHTCIAGVTANVVGRPNCSQTALKLDQRVDCGDN